MNLFEFRRYLESSVPLWVPAVIGCVMVLLGIWLSRNDRS